MSSYRLTPRATENLESISDHIAEWNAAAAKRVVRTIRDSFLFLAEHPQSGTTRDYLPPEVRVFSLAKPANNYVVVFQPVEGGVEILTIIHGARDLESDMPVDE